jgi:hypothetical protein
MRRNQTGIAVTAAVAVLSVAAVTLGRLAPVLTVLGVALVAAPGYIWGEVLLSSRVAGLERIVVATGLALAVPVVGGLGLYAVGVPLHRIAWVGLLASATLAGDAVLLVWGRPDASESSTPSRERKRAGTRHAVAFGAAAVIAVSGVGLACAGAAMQQYPRFTELWLSPRDATTATTDLGVTNHQGTVTRYRLVLLRNGHVSASWNLALADSRTWQREINFAGRKALAANLYRLPDLTKPYRHVTLTADRAPG